MGLMGLKRENIVKLLNNDNVFASVILAICVNSFGTECFDWEPDTLIMELEEDFNIQLSQVNRDKLNAILTVITTDQFYKDPVVFWQVGNVLSGTPANFVTGADPLTVDEAAWAAVEAALIDMPDGDLPQPSYSSQVSAMVGAILKSEGFSRPPQFLKFATMPERHQAMDLDSESGQEERMNRLEEDLTEGIREQLDELNLQLRQLPFAERSTPPDATKPRDFLDETLSLARGGRQQQPSRQPVSTSNR